MAAARSGANAVRGEGSGSARLHADRQLFGDTQRYTNTRRKEQVKHAHRVPPYTAVAPEEFGEVCRRYAASFCKKLSRSTASSLPPLCVGKLACTCSARNFTCFEMRMLLISALHSIVRVGRCHVRQLKVSPLVGFLVFLHTRSL